MLREAASISNSMGTPVSQPAMPPNILAIRERLSDLAASDLNEFQQFLMRLRKVCPEQAAEAFLWYIADNGLNPAVQYMSAWLGVDVLYVSVLLTSENLPLEVVANVIAVVKQMDTNFLVKFAQAASTLKSPQVILRALALFPGIGDHGVLIPWLRSLAQNTDMRVRSRSAKLLCELRPNKSLIERQMQSTDPRVRAGAIEALWQLRSEDGRQLFQAALTDFHHRVVGNALVGLYRLGDTGVLNDMIALCVHKDHLFRATMAWAMGFVKDLRAIPILRDLSSDKSHLVRKNAIKSLDVLESLPPPQSS
jgi:hypothetical protein